MIEGESILCFAPEKWEHIWRNRHQIMSRLARRNKVLFVEPRPYLRTVWQDWRKGKLGWPDLTKPLVTKAQDNLWVYRTPLYAPLSGRFPLAVFFRWLRETQLKKTMRDLGFQSPILWLYRPHMADVLGRFGEKMSIYHIVDEYAAYEAEFASVYGQSRRAAVEQKEKALLQAVDLVIVTADSLLERKRAYNVNTHWVPNGVDYDAFASVALRNPEPPADLAALPRPIIGYVGAINEKLDYDLLRQVAETYAQGSLVLVGPLDLRLDFTGLRKLELPNVHFLGAKPVSAVPCYIHACQVCLMPYKLNEWTAHISPLKLYEYLAMGKPIVSTAIPAARGHSDLIRIAENRNAFCQLIGEVLDERDEDLRRQRMEIASHNTWDDRVERLSQLIQITWERKGMSRKA